MVTIMCSLASRKNGTQYKVKNDTQKSKITQLSVPIEELKNHNTYESKTTLILVEKTKI